VDISASLVKDLREKTGAGVMDCKKALAETEGDLDQALVYLREKGLAQAQQKIGRATGEGLVGSYIHPGGKIGVLIEVNCETDFVARTPEFQILLKELAMQVAAQNPRFVRRDDVPADMLDGERRIYRAQALETGKPEKVVDNIVQGKIEKFFADVCLLEQEFIRDPGKKVEEVIREAIARMKENIQVRRFVRFQLGD
jgi:elongation factor Ts